MKYLFLSFFGLTSFSIFANDFELIRNRLFQSVVDELSLLDNHSENSKKLDRVLDLFVMEKGIFSDLDYVDHNVTTWGPKIHLQRLLYIAQVYQNKKHPDFQNLKIKKVIESSLNHWNFDQYVNENWWSNLIGLPRLAVEVLLLMNEELSDESHSALKLIISKALNAKKMSGQNLVWLAEILLTYGAVTESFKNISEAVERVGGEVEVSRFQMISSGIKDDLSFHQHGRVFYNGGYGLDFSRDLSRFFLVLNKTKFSFAQNKIDLLANFIVHGQFWLMRGDNFNFSAVGRYYARPKYSGLKLKDACFNMSQLASPYKKSLESCARSIGKKVFHGVVGNRYFPNGAFLIHNRKAFSASVKMLSKNVLSADTTPTSEGLYNLYLSDGVNFIQRRGDEYEDIFPFLDWRRLPGTTETKAKLMDWVDQRHFGNRKFVGAISDGSNAIASMDFSRGKLIKSPHYTVLSSMNFIRSHLVAKKSWFFIDDIIIALGAGINHSGLENHEVWTSINQVNGNGDVFFTEANSDFPYKLKKKYTGSLSWVHHDETGYFNLSASNKFVINKKVKNGSWYDISKIASKEKIKKEIFDLWIEHGENPVDQAYSYIIKPGIELEEMNDKKESLKGLRVISNTKSQQSLEYKNYLMASFYEKGSLESNRFGLVTVSEPAIIMIKKLEGSLINIRVRTPKETFFSNVLKLSIDGEYSCNFCNYLNKSKKTIITMYAPEVRVKLCAEL